ncbi:hypothetical protein [Paraliomyxa miuraensis]|uniref:hypothetical protein n=1 Tax=Paraliomyxa miuraensis TaxID=376150 RepID=UPI00224D356F|nr:hypothetical protein [Paraliomyxa miuraensis]MCX4242081.1 hypothetical protein [Paraliomyxa miuraensis]
MTFRSITPILLVLVSTVGCQCADTDLVEPNTEASSSSADESSSGVDDGIDASTGEPFDASHWIGRYHFENVFLPFGERGDPLGDFSLINFEIRPDSRATMFYDDCHFEEPIVIAYEWDPSEDGWLSLRPGEGESSLRFMADPDVEMLRVRLIQPCRELEFDYDGSGVAFTVIRPGASCWVDKCTTPGIIQVDYCEGEEPTEPCE